MLGHIFGNHQGLTATCLSLVPLWDKQCIYCAGSGQCPSVPLNRTVVPPSTPCSLTGVITALAVAVAVLAGALLSSIAVAVYRGRVHYSRAV